MTAFIYLRCNSGHYFTGSQLCPLDGWSANETSEAFVVATALVANGESLSVAALRAQGLTDETLARVIVIEFPFDRPPFELIAPDGYVIDGKWTPLLEAGLDLK